MDTDSAIDALRAFCQEYGANPPLGKTVDNASGPFERMIHVEWVRQGKPLWAWINTQDQVNSIGFYFRRPTKISFGPKPFTGDPNMVTTIPIGTGT